jgi:hypothetical protein
VVAFALTGDEIDELIKQAHDIMYSTGDSQWGWGEHCWHTWKEYPLFTSVEIRCSKCGKLKEDDSDKPAEEAR